MSEKAEFFGSRIKFTYSDVTMEPRETPYRVEELDISSYFTEGIRMPLPVVSAAMDTVTTAPMAIAMAEEGGIGAIHCAFGIERQKREVRKVKKVMSGKIQKPITYFDDQTVGNVMDDYERNGYDFRTFPVINREGNFSGLLTGTHFLFPSNRDLLVRDVMTLGEKVVTASGNIRINSAAKTMEANGITTLPVIGRTGRVTGLWLYSNVNKILYESHGYNLDEKGSLRVAAAVPTDDTALERIKAMQKYLDVAVIDSAQGDTIYYAYETLKAIKREFPDLPVIVGNITNPESAKNLAKLGAAAIKIGQGPGSICTTRQQTGIGYPQLSAVWRCAEAVKGSGVLVIADGGIQFPGDISKALAAGASSVMLGSLLAGTDQAPGEAVTLPDGTRARIFRGMGSASAFNDSEAAKNRYGGRTPLAEGVESYIPEKGDVHLVLDGIRKALLRSFMYTGVKTVYQHQSETNFVQLSQGAIAESGAHIVSRSFKII